jgi:AraC-like DNA-binding protein
MIGKTRQKPEAQVEEVFDEEVGRARGILRRELPASTAKLRHARRAPPPDLAEWITHYWMIGWDLRGCEPQLVENLPHPNIHLVFEEGSKAYVLGVQTSKFARVLRGRGQVFGVKFKPGGFRPFLKGSVSSLGDRKIPAKRIFGKAVLDLKKILTSSCANEEKMEAASAFFRERKPRPDKTIAIADELVKGIFEKRDIKTVNDLAERARIGKRSIQRIFKNYVGVSPKWVILRYRLHEVIEQLNSLRTPDWAQLALELGYFDQAHLINDFKSMVGCTPTQFQRTVAKARS